MNYKSTIKMRRSLYEQVNRLLEIDSLSDMTEEGSSLSMSIPAMSVILISLSAESAPAMNDAAVSAFIL